MKVYAVCSQDKMDIDSGIRPCPFTIVRIFKEEETAIDYERKVAYFRGGYERKHAWCYENGLGEIVFIREYEVM